LDWVPIITLTPPSALTCIRADSGKPPAQASM